MELSRNVVLLITHSGDYYTVDRVAEALSKRGVQPFRLDTDKFPLQVQMEAKLSNSQSIHRLKYGDDYINTKQIKAVWMRRIWQPQISQDLAPEFQAACIRESMAALNAFWDSLREVFWLDDLQRILAAENKLRQLRVAKEVGLVIPLTLVTNNPQEVRQFFYDVGGKMITKLLTPISYSMKGSPFFFYTSVVKEEDLLDIETLRYSPMIFQEEIPKLRELRVVYVDGSLFVGALDASKYATATVDWRNAPAKPCAWETHEFPSEVASRLKAFMAKFGLMFGALDLIETPSGEYVFLEVNPTGEWGMLERDLDYPISSAIAHTLHSQLRVRS
ncbi:MAG: MvdC family ATP-grasp ribosomal peptide maturase [Rivularia sp. (in: cyanobacteria)]